MTWPVSAFITAITLLRTQGTDGVGAHPWPCCSAIRKALFPSLLNREPGRIDLKNQTLIFQVVENGALTVRGGELRPTAEVDRAHNFSGSGIDRGGAVVVAVEGENSGGGGIKNNRVWLLAEAPRCCV